MKRMVSSWWPRGNRRWDGKDGWIECLFEADHTLHITEEHGHVDYRNLGTVQNTRKGEAIAKRHLPGRGENGYTVTGRALQAKHGKVVDWKTGEKVIVDQGKGAIMGGETTARKSIRVKVAGAEMSGRIKLIILGKVEFMRKLEQLKKTLKDTEAQLEQFYKSVDRFVHAFPDAEVRAARMSEVENFLSGKYEVANREMEEVQAILKEQDDSRLYVLERIYGNTEVTISLYSTTVHQEHGPSELSVSAGRIIILPL